MREQHFEILIPSRGRAKKQLTADLMRDAGLRFTVFVEPQEEEEYRESRPDYNYHILPEGNRGIVYVRNYMLNYCREQRISWALIVDDDISAYGIVQNNKMIKKDATILLRAFNTIKRFKPAMAGFSYHTIAWTQDKEITKNRLVTGNVFFNIDQIDWNYAQVDSKEDVEFFLTCVKRGRKVLRLNLYWYKVPPLGSNKGGLYEDYQQKKYEPGTLQVCKMHPEVTRPEEKSGRLDVKIDWKELDRITQ